MRSFYSFVKTITRSFAKSHLGIGMKPVILKVVDRKNKSWSVNYSFKGSNKARFGDGWKAFARDTAIKIGDICAFAMTKTIKSIVFEVTIYREIGNTDFTSLPGKRCSQLYLFSLPVRHHIIFHYQLGY